MEEEKEKESKLMTKNKKQNNDYNDRESSEEENELLKKKKKKNLDEKTQNLTSKKEITIKVPDSLGIKKVKKNNSNPGPNPLSNILSCGMCQMLIGKKEYKSCSKCPG